MCPSRKMASLQFFSVSLFLIGIFSLWFPVYGYEGPQTVDVQCNHSGIISTMYMDSNFEGVVYSQGNFFNPFCRYEVQPVSYGSEISFFLPLNNCGTTIRELDGEIYMSNTIVIQKYRFAETSWDVTRNVSCKVPPHQTLNLEKFMKHGQHDFHYQRDDLESWMEFKSGADIFGPGVASRIRVGEDILLVIHLKDGGQNRDLRVRECWAFEGETFNESKYVIPILELSKCEKSDWMSNFSRMKGMQNISDTVLYAKLKAFKFPGSANLHLTCSVEVCVNPCFKYCDAPEYERQNLVTETEKIYRRSVSRLSEKSFRERLRLMKATIKALGKTLLNNKSSISENDSSFLKRNSYAINSEFSINDADVTEMSPTTREILDASSNSPFSEISINATSTYFETFSISEENTWNREYYFNLTNYLVVLSAYDYNFRHEIFNLSQIASKCVSKLRFLMITVLLSFLTFCLALICIALALTLRKEKKKHLIDNFLLYNFN